MRTAWEELFALLCRPPRDLTPPTGQSNSYREVIALQGILMTLIVALLAYIQRDPIVRMRVDAMFAILASIPMMGLYHIIRGRVSTAEGDLYVYSQPIRVYARKVFFLSAAIVVVVCVLYWLGQLPGQ